MGQNSSSKKGLAAAIERSESRVGKVSVSGRYHKVPKRLADDYQLQRAVLGSGYNGSVHKATSKINGKNFAVKGFKLHGVSRDKKEELESECEIFLSMDHPHVARLVDVYEDENHLNLVMECMGGGELFKRVTERKRFSEKDACDAAWQMLLAITYIHSHGVVHRDIKLENYLYDSPDSDHLKLIDFGFSKIWSPNTNTKMAVSCGTLAYVAPEVLEKDYTSQCDMWSFGVTVFIVTFGYMPFFGAEEHQVAYIKKGKYTEKAHLWNKVSRDGQDFVRKLLVVDPNQRLTAQTALEHPWIKLRDEQENQKQLDQDTANALIEFAQGSQFRRAAMQMMAWSLTNEERAEVREAFIEIDKDRSGAISIVEFKQVLEERFHIDHEVAQNAFNALDQNHQDEIHYSEFLAAMVSSRIKMHDDLLKETFKRFDTSNTGYITEDDLKVILGETFEPEEVHAMVQDVNTQGQDGRISYAEFIHYLQDNPESKHQDAAAKLVDAKAKESGRAQTARPKEKTQDKGAAPASDKEKPPQCCGIM